jgi:hypothetical protein
MATLTADKRNNLSKSTFGLPGERKYPMPDKAHAANAKARASQQEAKGNLSPSAKAQIDAKANKVLGHGGDRKGTSYHMAKADQHIQKALEKRLASKDK